MAMSQLPPPGRDRNYGPAFLAIAIVSGTLAFLTTIARILGRTLIVRSVGWDDYTIVAAAVCSNGRSIYYSRSREPDFS